MPKSFRYLAITLISLTFNICVCAQTEVEYKAVLLDGKPAKLNRITGEITLVNSLISNDNKPSTLYKGLGVDKDLNVKDTSDFYIVKKGERLLDISRRYNVSMTNLKQANRLETTVVKEGQRLRVKNFESQLDDSVEHVDIIDRDNQKTVLNDYIVKKNETLYSISKSYNLSLNELKRLNNLKSNVITVGQKLRVNNIDGTKDVISAAVWVVSKGDTLFSIAQKSGVSVDTIKFLNGLNSNLISIGQKLKLK